MIRTLILAALAATFLVAPMASASVVEGDSLQVRRAPEGNHAVVTITGTLGTAASDTARVVLDDVFQWTNAATAVYAYVAMVNANTTAGDSIGVGLDTGSGLAPYDGTGWTQQWKPTVAATALAVGEEYGAIVTGQARGLRIPIRNASGGVLSYRVQVLVLTGPPR